MWLFDVAILMHQGSTLLCLLKNLRSSCFLFCLLCFLLFVMIILDVTLLYKSCNDNILSMAPQSMVACVLILGFFHCVSGFGHVGDW